MRSRAPRARCAARRARAVHLRTSSLTYGYQPTRRRAACGRGAARGPRDVRVLWLVRSSRVAVTIVGATLTSAYFLVLVSTITNEAWGWSVSLDLGRAYLRVPARIVGNLPVSHGLVPSALLRRRPVFLVAIWAGWWRAAPSLGVAAATMSWDRRCAILVSAFSSCWCERSRPPPPSHSPHCSRRPGSCREGSAGRNANALRAYGTAPIVSRAQCHPDLSDALRADHMGVYGYSASDDPFLSHSTRRVGCKKVKLAMATCPFTRAAS